jgi:hypothetical protein
LISPNDAIAIPFLPNNRNNINPHHPLTTLASLQNGAAQLSVQAKTLGFTEKAKEVSKPVLSRVASVNNTRDSTRGMRAPTLVTNETRLSAQEYPSWVSNCATTNKPTIATRRRCAPRGWVGDLRKKRRLRRCIGRRRRLCQDWAYSVCRSRETRLGTPMISEPHSHVVNGAHGCVGALQEH